MCRDKFERIKNPFYIGYDVFDDVANPSRAHGVDDEFTVVTGDRLSFWFLHYLIEF